MENTTTTPALAAISGSAEADYDHEALIAACEPGVRLCTLVGIDGSFSRRLGAQLAVMPDGGIVGSLSDGCLERQLAHDSQQATVPFVQRYGRGSPIIDFRLPCGGGLDILIDPDPDRATCIAVRDSLARREPAALALPDNPLLAKRDYLPALAIRAFGEGPELAFFASFARAAGISVEAVDKAELSLGRASGRTPADAWTAIVLLFHDHEWELALLEEALAGEAFYIGAQGGALARAARLEELRRRDIDEAQLARIRSPIGSTRGSRTPRALALSALAEITDEYERQRSST